MKYLVEGGVAFIGTDMTLQLSKEQVEARKLQLEEVKGGWRPRTVVQFKAGEAIEIDLGYDELPRSLAAVLLPASGRRTARPKTPVNKGAKKSAARNKPAGRKKAAAPQPPASEANAPAAGSGAPETPPSGRED